MKYFVIGDVHSFFDKMKQSLDKVEFDPNNSEHILIGLGDYFDRGNQSWEMLQYLNQLPNKVLVRGNHEDLILDCIARREYWSHDLSNGTAQTIMDLGEHYEARYTPIFSEACAAIESPIKRFVESTVDFYETEHYIFTHAGIPCIKSGSKYSNNNTIYSFIEDWRVGDWESARWGNPFEAWQHGISVEGKTIVCGHWHTSWAHANIEHIGSEWDADADFSPFYAAGIIGLDACTAYSGKVNVLVLED